MFTVNHHPTALYSVTNHLQYSPFCKPLDLQKRRFPNKSGMTNKAVALTKIYRSKATTIPSYFTKPFSRYSARFVRTRLAASSAATLRMSLSTMSFTSCSNVVFCGFQPSSALALVGSPQRFTTSVGR